SRAGRASSRGRRPRPPQSDSMAVAAQLGGEPTVGGAVGFGSSEHEAAAEGQPLGRGGGASHCFQTVTIGDSEEDKPSTWDWHDDPQEEKPAVPCWTYCQAGGRLHDRAARPTK